MRKFVYVPVLLLIIASAALGDTIHLKNGSVLKGKVASFADDQFIIMLDTGSGRYLSRAMVYMGDVARIEFDSSPAVDSDASASKPSEATSRPSASDARASAPEQPKETKITETPREVSPPETQPTVRETQPAARDIQPAVRETQPPAREPESVQPEKSQPEKPQPEKPMTSAPAASASEPAPDTERNPRKLTAVKSLSVDVVAKKDWTSSGLIVKRGDHVRVTATGTITLDPVTGRTCGPEGLSDLVDPKKLMPDQPTGSLIAVISSDNDDFIFLGKSGEFTATRDGLLFLSVNEGHLPDNSGSFKAVVEVLGTKK